MGTFNNILVLSLLLALPVRAEKEEPPQMPPQPVPAKVQVESGGSVRIPLRTYGIPQDVEFRIRSKPRMGRLGGLRVLDKGLGVVTYTHLGEKGAGSDRFTYAAKSVLGVSAEVEVGISIVEPPPKLVVPAGVDFGKVLVGSRAAREIEIENKGGGIAEGQVEVQEPWKVVGRAQYRIGGGESQMVMLVLEPGNTGKMERSVVFTSDRTQMTTVEARVVSEVEAGPQPLVLKRSGTTMEREGVLEVVNNTPRTQRLGFQWGDGLDGLKEAELAPLGSERVKVTALNSDCKGFESVVAVKTEKESQRVKVMVPALPGRIRVSPEQLVLSPAPAPQAVRTGLFTVENTGGQRLQVTLESTPPVECEVRDSFDLVPGETRQIKVSAPDSPTGSAEGGIMVGADGESRRLRVLMPGRVMASSPAAQLPAPQPEESAGQPMPPVQQDGVADGVSKETLERLLLAPRSLSVSGLTRTSAVLSWKSPSKGAASYRLERRELFFDDSRELQQRWLPAENAQTAITNDGARADVKGLQPGTPHSFRVVAVSTNGEESVPSPIIVFQTRPPLSFRPSLLQVLLAALAVMAFVIVRKWRKRD